MTTRFLSTVTTAVGVGFGDQGWSNWIRFRYHPRYGYMYFENIISYMTTRLRSSFCKPDKHLPIAIFFTRGWPCATSIVTSYCTWNQTISMLTLRTWKQPHTHTFPVTSNHCLYLYNSTCAYFLHTNYWKLHIGSKYAQVHVPPSHTSFCGKVNPSDINITAIQHRLFKYKLNILFIIIIINIIHGVLI